MTLATCNAVTSVKHVKVNNCTQKISQGERHRPYAYDVTTHRIESALSTELSAWHNTTLSTQMQTADILRETASSCVQYVHHMYLI
ncbi:hypothetical protein HOLleu_11209 [Holothuria leucospilota]|uniref:Uncharacterized protein n=1 Tax=Holothuria leucospilota TaxID=206669 RepID=A0A9Q1HGA8_HOLLE|nr:hypothetical protein HOLleu_11209 [Holothuria leucospilota]